MYADALVYITSQKNEWDYTKYTLGVEKYDEDEDVTGFALYTGADCAASTKLNVDGLWATIEDGDTFTIDNIETTQTIRCVEWNGKTYSNSGYADYFKVGWDSWRVFSNK